MIATFLSVGLGGALGAMARFGVGILAFRLTGPGFPLGILAVNVLGSFAMGALLVFLGQRGLGHLNPFLMTGFLGGFTTFSAFSLEAFSLFERGLAGQAALYVALSVGLSIGALVLGVQMTRGLLA